MKILTFDPNETPLPEDSAENSQENIQSDDNFSEKNTFDCEYDNWSPD